MKFFVHLWSYFIGELLFHLYRRHLLHFWSWRFDRRLSWGHFPFRELLGIILHPGGGGREGEGLFQGMCEGTALEEADTLGDFYSANTE